MSNKHFLQTKYWAQVREALGHKPVFVQENLILVKPMSKPFKDFGYMPQVRLAELNFDELASQAAQLNLSHIQLDPADPKGSFSFPDKVLSKYQISPTESVYYRDTLVIDLTKSEEELLEEMHKKHRYNIRVAQKHEVKITVSDSEADFEEFLKLFFETVERQKYFGRDRNYYKTIWAILKPQGKVKIATATYQGNPLVCWMLFLDEDTIYYPYGGSSDEHRNVMAANGLVWGLIQWGRAEGYKQLDLWGIDPQTGSDGEIQHGFSRFKINFGGTQVHYTNSYDVIIDPFAYSIFKIGNSVRWFLLKLKSLI
jgi:peptidoglycan pentaglycine glycine transferase (the first glycine)